MLIESSLAPISLSLFRGAFDSLTFNWLIKQELTDVYSRFQALGFKSDSLTNITRTERRLLLLNYWWLWRSVTGPNMKFPCRPDNPRAPRAASVANSTLLKWNLLCAANQRSREHLNWRQNLGGRPRSSPTLFPAAKSPRRYRYN